MTRGEELADALIEAAGFVTGAALTSHLGRPLSPDDEPILACSAARAAVVDAIDKALTALREIADIVPEPHSRVVAQETLAAIENPGGAS